MVLASAYTPRPGVYTPEVADSHGSQRERERNETLLLPRALGPLSLSLRWRASLSKAGLYAYFGRPRLTHFALLKAVRGLSRRRRPLSLSDHRLPLT